MEIISKLKYSHKGQLNYERNTNFVHLYDDLQKCAFPPLRNFYHHSNSTDKEKIGSTDNSRNNSHDPSVIKNESVSRSSKGFRTMPALTEEYLQRKVAILEYEALWDKKVKRALKKKMWEFYENDRKLHQKMKLALKDLSKQGAFRENCRDEELWAQQKELAHRCEQHREETVYFKLQGEVGKETKSSREEKEMQPFDCLQNRRKNFYPKTNRFRKS